MEEILKLVARYKKLNRKSLMSVTKENGMYVFTKKVFKFDEEQNPPVATFSHEETTGTITEEELLVQTENLLNASA
jgi:hypothetical protein